jgi:uncharacterized membrane protein YoaK (UPF0700 family)
MWDSQTRTLLVLTFVTGIVDAVSFLALGHVFAAMQTGNVIFLGLGIGGAAGAAIAAPLVGLVAYLVGSAAIAAGLRPGTASEPAALTLAMLVEVGLLGAAALGAALSDPVAGEAPAYALIALLSGTMGMRNTIVRRLGDPNLTTTVLTLTVSGLLSHSPFGIASEDELGTRAAAVVAIVAGAVLGTLLLRQSAAMAIAAAALVVLLAALAHGRAVAGGLESRRAGA